jgi:transposase
MAKSHDLRDAAVVSHYKNGKKAPEVARLLANRIHRSTIDRWLGRYKQSGSVDIKPQSEDQ